jgi:hypothetical protein
VRSAWLMGESLKDAGRLSDPPAMQEGSADGEGKRGIDALHRARRGRTVLGGATNAPLQPGSGETLPSRRPKP